VPQALCAGTQWAEFAHQRRTRLEVVADMPSTHSLLIKLEQFRHQFLTHFHSHPGQSGATHPSGNERFQKRLEAAGHVAVMAIFSRDGFVRFVRLEQNLEIEIYGEGVESYAPGIYRLKKHWLAFAGKRFQKPRIARRDRTITFLDDVVEESNLNPQRFYIKDVGQDKALALAQNLMPECIVETD
jgi:hypothetical protein